MLSARQWHAIAVVVVKRHGPLVQQIALGVGQHLA